MAKFGVAQSIRRVEDPRLLKGAGSFTADYSLPGMLQGLVLRSPHAAARIVSIDTAAGTVFEIDLTISETGCRIVEQPHRIKNRPARPGRTPRRTRFAGVDRCCQRRCGICRNKKVRRGSLGQVVRIPGMTD